VNGTPRSRTCDPTTRYLVKIARADVAHFIGTALTSASYIRESPALAY
jgi:hypothetical protein